MTRPRPPLPGPSPIIARTSYEHVYPTSPSGCAHTRSSWRSLAVVLLGASQRASTPSGLSSSQFVSCPLEEASTRSSLSQRRPLPTGPSYVYIGARVHWYVILPSLSSFCADEACGADPGLFLFRVLSSLRPTRCSLLWRIWRDFKLHPHYPSSMYLIEVYPSMSVNVLLCKPTSFTDGSESSDYLLGNDFTGHTSFWSFRSSNSHTRGSADPQRRLTFPRSAQASLTRSVSVFSPSRTQTRGS
jgi:hypothetical protein